MDQDSVSKSKHWLYKTTALFMLVVTVVFIALFFLVLEMTGVIKDTPVDRSTIRVTGVAEKFVAPDIAYFSFSVREEASTVEEAQRMATEKTNEIIKFLKGEVAEKDIKTTGYNIQPDYEYYYENSAGLRCDTNYCPPPYFRKQEIVGHIVSQNVRVTVRDVDEDSSIAGELLSGIGELEVHNLSGLSFEVDDRDAVVESVKNEAIADAREKAEARAKALGVKLGKVMSFSEDGYYPEPYYARTAMMGVAMDMEEMAMESAPAPELPVGENEITSRVTVTYEIR